MNETKAVLFDLDGTLLDTLWDLTDATNYILKKYGYVERSAKEVRSFLGSGAAHLIRSALPCAVEDSVFEKYLKDYVEYYRENSKHKTAPYPGILELLAFLKEQGIKTAIVSNKPDAATRGLCAYYFDGLIDFSVGDRADIERKPSAEPVAFAMKALGCDRAVFVGDSDVDVLTGKNAGLPCISVTWGFRDRNVLEACGSDCFADDAEELKAHILELLGVDGGNYASN